MPLPFYILKDCLKSALAIKLKSITSCVPFTQRTACHIQVFALSRWLADTLPVEYYEFARGIQWSIPYFNLPWETGQSHPVMVGSSSPHGPHSYISKFNHLAVFQSEQPVAGNSNSDAAVYGSPLTPMEYESFFEVKIKFSCYVTYFSALNGIL